MHVLVTGGAGFIGSHSVDRLIELGATVRVFDSFSSGRETNLTPHTRLQLVTGDIRDRDSVEKALDGMSHVLHLAAQVSVTASVLDPLESGSTNVSGYLNVLDVSRRRQVERFVYASSSAVYGVPQDDSSSETAIAEPISPYGLEKLIDDQYAELYASLYGLSTLGLRYFNVFGPRQDSTSPYSGVISIFIRLLQQAQPLVIFGDGEQTRDFIYVEDVANVNALALNSAITGVCNIGTGRAMSVNRMIELLCLTVKQTPAVHCMPERDGDIRHSRADIGRMRDELQANASTSVAAGLDRLWRAAESNR